MNSFNLNFTRKFIIIELQNLQPPISQLKKLLHFNLRIYFKLNFMLTLKHNIYLIHQNAMPQGIVQTYVIDQTCNVPGTCKMQHMFNKFKEVGHGVCFLASHWSL